MVLVFVQMNFSDAVVIETDGLADGILGNFEPAIQITPESCFEIKPYRKTPGMGPQAFKEIRPVGRLAQDGREMFPHCAFVVAAY